MPQNQQPGSNQPNQNQGKNPMNNPNQPKDVDKKFGSTTQKGTEKTDTDIGKLADNDLDSEVDDQ